MTRTEPSDERARLLHEEIERLPERLRVPLVLCDLGGRTHEEAARHLGCPVGTVKSRIARARDRLRDRLRRRGLGPDSTPVLAALRLGPADAVLPKELTTATVRLAIQTLTARSLVGGSVAFLAREVLMSMFMTQALRVGSVLLVLGAAGAAGAGWLGHRDASGVEPRAGAAVQAAPAGEEPPVSEVKAGRFRVNVVERGVVETSRVEDVYSQIQGLTTIIFIRPDGSVVKKGERICELDSSALKDQLINQEITARAAEAAYQTAKRMRELAEIALTEFREGTYKIERETILGAIAMAREGMKKAETRLERTRRARQKMTDLLSRKGGATEPAELLAELEIDDRQDASERSIAHEKVALELAQSKLQLLDNYTKGRTVAELESAIERKKSEERAKEAAWELEKAKAEKLRRQIASCTLLAPYDGVVVLANNPNRAGGPVQIEEGATVRERQKLLSVRDRHGPMRVRTRIHDSNVSRVRPGLRAEIKVDAFVDRRLTGRVTSVGPLPDQAPGEKSYRALVELDETPSSLLPGFTADIEILVTERENVLSVPVEAVSRFEGKDHVAVRQPGGRFAWREVTLGLTNDKNVEVKQGLKAGEIVSLKPNAVMKDSGKRGG